MDIYVVNIYRVEKLNSQSTYINDPVTGEPTLSTQEVEYETFGTAVLLAESEGNIEEVIRNNITKDYKRIEIVNKITLAEFDSELTNHKQVYDAYVADMNEKGFTPSPYPPFGKSIMQFGI